MGYNKIEADNIISAAFLEYVKKPVTSMSVLTFMLFMSENLREYLTTYYWRANQVDLFHALFSSDT